VEKCYYGQDVLLEEIRATMDVMVASDTGEPLHYILVTRAVVLGASQFKVKPSQNTAAAIPRREVEDDEAGPEAGQQEENGEKEKERLTDKLRREAAERTMSLPVSRCV